MVRYIQSRVTGYGVPRVSRVVVAMVTLLVLGTGLSCLVRLTSRPYPTNETASRGHFLRLHADGGLTLNGTRLPIDSLASSIRALPRDRPWILLVKDEGVPLKTVLSVGEVIAAAGWSYFVVDPDERTGME